jgi:predicted PurR-regulated permease PerM
MNGLRNKLEDNLGWGLLALLLLGCLLVMWPFVTALLWAGVLSYSTWPLYVRLLGFLRGRRTLAALVVTLGMVALLGVPFAVVGVTLGKNVDELKTATQRVLDQGLPPVPAWVARIPAVGQIATDGWNNLTKDTSKLVEKAKTLIEPVSAWLLRNGLKLGAGLAQLALSLLLTFFFLRRGLVMAEALTQGTHRIAGERGRHLLQLAGNTVRGVVYGIIGTALAQALMAGIGFAIAGVPGAALLALLTFFLSVVPVGPPLVWLPAALWLFFQGSTGWGIFMVIWGVGVSTVDNFVKPWLISQGSDMPFMLILFGVLGGAMAYGLIGVFLGPTLLAVGYRLVSEWASSRQSAAAGDPLMPEGLKAPEPDGEALSRS